MILFLDVDKRIISLYKDDGVVNIPFVNAKELFKHTGSNDFFYVTNAVETNSNEVIKLIEDIGVVVEDVKAPAQEKKTYIHIAGEGVIPISDELRFRGHYDAHPLTSELLQEIKNTPLLQMLIKTGKLELITSSKRKALEEERLRKEDEKLGSILVDRDDMEEPREHGDAEVIDFTSELSGDKPLDGGGGMSDISELLSEVEGLE